MTIDELKDNTTAIDCCYCGYSITTADLSDEKLQILIDTGHVPHECEEGDCNGIFMIGIDKSEYERMQYNAAFGVYEVGANYLTVEEVHRCKTCCDELGWMEDKHVPGSLTGHSEVWHECDCTKKSE